MRSIEYFFKLFINLSLRRKSFCGIKQKPSTSWWFLLDKAAFSVYTFSYQSLMDKKYG
jgi:hypothetical protein